MAEIDSQIPMSYKYGPSPMEQMGAALTLADMMDKRKIQQKEIAMKEKLLPAQIEKANLENRKIESETAKNYSAVGKDKFDMQKSILDIAKSHVEGLNKETSFLGQQASAIDLNNPEQALQLYKDVIFPHASAFMFYDKSTIKKPEEMDLNGLSAFKKYATTQATDLALQETQAYHAQEAELERQRLAIEEFKARNMNNQKLTKSDRLLGIVDKVLRSDPIVKKGKDQYAYANNVWNLLVLENPVGDEAAKTQMARAAGEVGVLTDRDIARWGGSKAVAARAKQVVKQAASGRMTTENRDFMKDVVKRMKQNSADNVNNALDMLSAGQMAAYPDDLEEEKVNKLVGSYKIKTKAETEKPDKSSFDDLWTKHGGK